MMKFYKQHCGGFLDKYLKNLFLLNNIFSRGSSCRYEDKIKNQKKIEKD